MNEPKEPIQLLRTLHHVFEQYPFDADTEVLLRMVDFETIKHTYANFVETDNVANAIHWSVGVLQELLEKKTVRGLDEVVSYVAKVLQENSAK